MRHKKHSKHFGRTANARKALFRGLVQSIVKHERIETTVVKAKELRRHVERAVTASKAGDFNAMRLLMAKYPDRPTVEKLVKVLGPRFKDRPGGYTRIIKLGARKGDGAETAFIEFVDYDFTQFDRKAFDKPQEIVIEERARKRKTLRNIQSESRKVNRPD